jgi:hypothetical protein
MSDAWVRVAQEHILQLEAIAQWASITGLGNVRDGCRMAQAELNRELCRSKGSPGQKSLDVQRIYNSEIADAQRRRAEAAEARAEAAEKALYSVSEQYGSKRGVDNLRSDFATDTLHRLAVEAARYWVVECWLRTRQLPTAAETRFVYADGLYGIGWGDDPVSPGPMRHRRIRVTFEVQDKYP